MAQIAFERKVPDVIISIMESDSQVESASSKCRRFSKEFQEESVRFATSSCGIQCYTKREIYYNGSIGSHIQLTRMITNMTGLCQHLADGTVLIGG